MPKSPAKWRTVRCVVEYRTRDPKFSERDLAAFVQSALGPYLDMYPSQLPDSKPWAKGFNAVVARMTAARPKKMRAALRAIDAAVRRLRAL